MNKNIFTARGGRGINQGRSMQKILHKNSPKQFK